MRRALELADLAEGTTSPNPRVGAVLVHGNRIIGEGFHQRYGESHAEVNAIRSVKPQDRHLIPQSVLYVTLEPCCIHGRTPPCTDLILQERIPRVVVSAIDRTPSVNYRGLDILKQAGVSVSSGVLEDEGSWMAAQRNVFVTQSRPYIVLKYALSRDGFMGSPHQRVLLSHVLSQRLVHRLRVKMDAIMVGTGTVLADNPLLNNRLYHGRSPLRVVLDRKGRLPVSLRMMDDPSPIWIFRQKDLIPKKVPPHVRYIAADTVNWTLEKTLTELSKASITGLLVEGGRELLRSFIDSGLWDEALIVSCPTLLKEGVHGPGGLGDPEDRFLVAGDEWNWFRNLHPISMKPASTR